MTAGEGGRGGGSRAGSPPTPPRRGASAHLERRSVTPPAGALQKHIQIEKKNKTKNTNQLGPEEPPGGTFRPGKVPTRPSVPGEVGSLRRSHSSVSLFC